MKNNKPYKYTAKDRLKKSSGFNQPKINTKPKKKKSLENTIKIDAERLNDMDLLDTSFLEGRVDSSVTKPKNSKKTKKEKNKLIINSSKILSKVHFFRNLFLSLALVCLFLIAVIFSYNYFKSAITDVLHARFNDVEKVEEEVDPIIDRNYLFVGDYLTDEFIFSKYGLDYHYVKSGVRNLTTENILYDGKGLIYDYNPSILFLEVGLFDIDNSISTEDIINNLDTIVKRIKTNRPYCKIYIESIYPLNSSVDGYDLKPFKSDITNETINETNAAIKNYCDTNDVYYLDVNSVLVKKNKLNKEFTDNGYSLNNDGYKQVYKLIKKIIEN